jgi:hypothetical protein
MSKESETCSDVINIINWLTYLDSLNINRFIV